VLLKGHENSQIGQGQAMHLNPKADASRVLAS
jgi:hypothetical protein